MTYIKQVKPFLKWAGGKNQLISQMKDYFPDELLTGKINKYIEPFVGGGAVFLHIAQSYQVSEFFIYDLNPELILAYQTIQQNVEELIAILRDIQDKYLALNHQERNNYFYQIRSQFNQRKKQINFNDYNSEWLERTAQIIFLNRTCFNGLFRVNRKGEFNVPVGRYKTPTICDRDNLRGLAKILQKTHIYQGDFSNCEKEVNKDTLVYFDPPYRPLNKTSNFNSYHSKLFDDSEQLRLRDFFYLLDNKKAKLILSNSDPKNENNNDNFFDEAYSKYQIKRIKASRFINSKGNKRGQINEILIMNY
jgi:DNA adenine methylase